MEEDKLENVDAILSKVFRLPKDDMTDDLTMESVVRWDSFTHMDLIASLESELNIQFDMDEIMSMKDIKSIKEITMNKVQGCHEN